MDNRITNEINQGKLIAVKGEEIWNWSTPAGSERLKRRVRLFKIFVGNSNKKVLEIGCGTGILTQELAKTNNNIFALDISPELLAITRKRVNSRRVRFFVGNAYQTKFKSNYFDYVVGSSVLHHLDIDSALGEIYRLLKDGGKFIFTEPNMLNPQIALERNVPLIRKIANNSPDETAFIKWQIKKKLAAAGFNRIAVKNFDFLHPLIPKLLIKPVSRLGKVLEKTPGFKEISGSLIISGRKEGDLDRLERYQKVWRRKKILRDIYRGFYRQIDADLVPGKTLELGSGIGGFKQYKPDIIASDIVKAKWLDRCFDAHSIPLPANSLANIVLIDVFHHLSRPVDFLNEAYRVLKPGGRIIFNEPFPSTVSLLIYRFFHPEPFMFAVDYFSDKNKPAGDKPAWTANQAIPYLFFYKQIGKFKRLFGKKFKLIKRDQLGVLAYPLSGGFENKQLVPDSFFPLLHFSEKLLLPLKRWLAFRCYIILEKQ